MANGISYVLGVGVTYKGTRGVRIETDALQKKLNNIILAVSAPPNYQPLHSYSGNLLFTLLQNTPVTAILPATAIYYCQQAIEPFVRGVLVRPYGSGSDVWVDGANLVVQLGLDIQDPEASLVALFTPNVNNPGASTLRLSES